jgi:hypothetical protein
MRLNGQVHTHILDRVRQVEVTTREWPRSTLISKIALTRLAMPSPGSSGQNRGSYGSSSRGYPLLA